MSEKGVTGRSDDRAPQEPHRGPTKSGGRIAAELDTDSQTYRRKKRKSGSDGVIRGRTAVIDDARLKHIAYPTLLEAKPLSAVISVPTVNRVEKNEMEEQDVRLSSCSTPTAISTGSCSSPNRAVSRPPVLRYLPRGLR